MSTDELTLDPQNLSPAAIRLVRTTFGFSGVVAAVLGILLLVVPGRTLQPAAILLGIHFVVATLLIIIVLFAGIGWILDGTLAIVESGQAESRAWAFAFGRRSASVQGQPVPGNQVQG